MSLNNSLLIVQKNINRYFCPISLSLGMIGCFFNILLFSQRQFRSISCCTYFLAASVAMLIALIVGLVPHIYSADHPSPSDTIVIFCKIRGYVGQSVTMMYRWLMTMACIDRYMVSSDNVYLRKLANPRMAYSIVKKVLILCIIFPIHNLIFLYTKEGWCRNSSVAYAFYHSCFTFTFGAFFPILIMIISVILIRSNLTSKQARRHDHMNHDQNPNSTVRLLNARDQQVLVMLFIQIIIYILSTIPWMIFLLYSTYGYHIKNKSINRISIENFVKYITEIIIYMYPTLSFYIYTLASQTFRAALMNIICTLFIVRDRSPDIPQALRIQTELLEESERDRSSKTCHFQSIEMETFFHSSTKINS